MSLRTANRRGRIAERKRVLAQCDARLSRRFPYVSGWMVTTGPPSPARVTGGYFEQRRTIPDVVFPAPKPQGRARLLTRRQRPKRWYHHMKQPVVSETFVAMSTPHAA